MNPDDEQTIKTLFDEACQSEEGSGELPAVLAAHIGQARRLAEHLDGDRARLTVAFRFVADPMRSGGEAIEWLESIAERLERSIINDGMADAVIAHEPVPDSLADLEEE